MGFKEYVKNDINNTFINNAEFAKSCKVNAVTVLVVEDSDKLEERIKSDYNGLIIGDILFYISLEEYRKIPGMTRVPQANQAINYNGKPCQIVEVKEQAGMYEIVLQTNGGR